MCVYCTDVTCFADTCSPTHSSCAAPIGCVGLGLPLLPLSFCQPPGRLNVLCDIPDTYIHLVSYVLRSSHSPLLQCASLRLHSTRSALTTFLPIIIIIKNIQPSCFRGLCTCRMSSCNSNCVHRFRILPRTINRSPEDPTIPTAPVLSC